MIRNIFVFTITLLVVTLAVGWAASQIAHPSFLILILVSLSIVTWLVYFFMLRTTSENFIKNYLLTIVLKIMAGGIFIFVLLYLDKAGADENALLFMAAYLLLTGLEVGFLFKKFGQS